MGYPMKSHPHTGALIVPVGHRKDGRPIYPILGASPDDPAPAPPADPGTDPAPADPPGTPAPPNPGEPGEPGDDDTLGEGGKRALQSERDARKAAERQLAEAQTAQQAQLDAIAKALGLKPDDAPADPAKLAEQIAAEQSKTTEAETRASAAERQIAIYRLAATGKHDGNPVALLDSATFLAQIKDVDPSDETAVLAAVSAALDANPSLKATPATPPFPGGARKTSTQPDPGPGLPRLRNAYAQSTQ